MKFKLVSCAVLGLMFVGACKKGPAAQATSGVATPPAATPAAPAGAGAPSGPPAAPVPPKPVPQQLPPVVARVNGENITKDDFDRMVKGIEMQAGQPVPPDQRDAILRNALDRLIVYTLLSQESKGRNLKIDENEIGQKIQEVRGRFQTEQAFEAALKTRGMTVDDLKKEARNDLTVSKLVDSEVATIPGPSDSEARDFYQKNPDRFKQGESVHAAHILIRVAPNADAATKAKARATIDDVLKKARAGADFGKLAEQYSQDGSASNKGDLGEFPRGQMVPEFDAAAFALKPGQLSDVVTTQFGYHVIKVIDRKPAGVVSYDEAAQQIKAGLDGQKKQQHMDAFIDGLKKKSKIEVLI
ncbi:MAG TPA: peptidylprolyl isomerase [Vicinamibacterales bacterium]